MSQWSELTTLTKLKYIGHWLASDDLSNKTIPLPLMMTTQ